MFDDLMGESSFTAPQATSPKPDPQQEYQSSGYQQYRKEGNGYANGQGGYQKRQGGYNGGSGGGFQRKPDEVTPPYLPVVFFLEANLPEEVRNKFKTLASKLIAKGYTIRINADDPAFVKQLQSLSHKNVELYLPWRNFNELESKHTYNTLTAKDIAQKNFGGWDKVPDSVKAILAAQVRMLFGDRNNSITLMVVTYSADGASRIAELTKDTGRTAFIIKTACTYGFSVVNLGKPSSEGLLEKYFDL